MKNLLEFAALTVMSILIGACSKTPQVMDSIPEVVFEEASPGFRITDSFNNVRAFQLELYDTCIVDEIRRIIPTDDERLLVLTKNELFAFDKNSGEFIQKLVRIGEGPDECLNIEDVYYDRKDRTINIIDTYGGKLVRYGSFGNFLSKEKIPFPADWFNGIARSDDGYMMIDNKMTGGFLQPPSEYSYTVVKPSGEYFPLDPFAPVSVDGNFATAFAKRPAVATGDSITFFKFLNDTIFTLVNGEISPEYKLSMKKKLPRKDVVAQTGNFPSCLISMSSGGDYLEGFTAIYETSRYIVLVPELYPWTGHFWIDKITGAGIHISSSSEVEIPLKMMLKGETIFQIKGSDNNSLIAAFEERSIGITKECLSENPDLGCFNEDVRRAFENADPEGNPVVIIYGH